MRQPPFSGRDEELKALQLELTLHLAHICAKLGLRSRRDLALQDLVLTGGS